MNDEEGEEFIKSVVEKRSLDFKLPPKAKKQRVIANSIINDDNYGSNTEDKKQYVQVLDKKLLQESSANVRKQAPLVIPLHLASGTDNLQKRAEEELLREIKGIENTGSSSLIISSTSSTEATASKEKKAPLLLANVRPEVRGLHDENDRFRADLEYRADDMNVKSNAYDSVPVEHFGAALLRGMGWTDDTQECKAVLSDARVAKHEHRQGLGATGQPPHLKNNRHQHNSQSQLNEWDKKVQDKLKQQSLSVGSIVLLQDRNIIGKRAVVTVIAGVPGLNKVRVAVEEANEEIIVSKETLLLLTDEELLLHPFKYGILEKVSSTSLYFGESSSFNRRPVEVSDSQQLPINHSDSKATSQNLTIKSTEMLQQRTSWLRTGIRVKLISKKFGIGLYSKKAFVVDVPSKNEATIQFDDGHMIENVKEKYLETVLPHSGGLCLVLTGDNAGEIANLIEKRDKEQAVIELIDSLEVLVVSMDSIAAFSEL